MFRKEIDKMSVDEKIVALSVFSQLRYCHGSEARNTGILLVACKRLG